MEPNSTLSCISPEVVRLVLFFVLTMAAGCGGGPGQTSRAGSLAPEDTAACGPQASLRDEAGALIGSTRDSTTISVRTPVEIRATTETTLSWHMTGGLTAPLTVYGEHPDGSRLDPRSIDAISQDDYVVRIRFPKAGCWRLHSERANGKLSGDLWLTVLPAR